MENDKSSESSSEQLEEILAFYSAFGISEIAPSGIEIGKKEYIERQNIEYH